MATSPIIVTDSTCDLPPALFGQYGIELVPLRVLFGSKESYRSGIDMNLVQFIERLNVGDIHPSTSQPTVHDFLQLYESLAPQGRPILSIHISEGLSGTANAAKQAAAQLPQQSITIHNSKTISAGLGMQVLAAARAAQSGYTVEQILPLIEKTYTATNLLFTLDDLSYLVRGGRIGSVQYHIAQALHIKPIITVSKEGDTLGTYITAGRIRSLTKGVDAFVAHVINDVGEGSKLRAMIFHGIGNTPELAARISEQLKQHFECVFLTTAHSTPVLAVHVSPLAFAMGYAAGDWDV